MNQRIRFQYRESKIGVHQNNINDQPKKIMRYGNDNKNKILKKW